jgi:hypothetical protein
MATPAETKQQRQAGDARTAMVDDERRRGETGLRTHAAEHINRNRTTIEWKFTRKKARLKLKYTITRS